MKNSQQLTQLFISKTASQQRKVKYLAFVMLVFLGLSSCVKKTTFKTHTSGLKYYVLEESNSERQPEYGDVVELELKYATESDSLLFSSLELAGAFRLKYREPKHTGGSFSDALSLVRVGERLYFEIPADSFFLRTQQNPIPEGVAKGSMVKFELKLLKIFSEQEVARERDIQRKLQQQEETRALNEYLAYEQIEAKPLPSGLYVIPKKIKKGKKPTDGDVVYVHYVASLINGKVFDSSVERNEIFAFKVGDEKVIAGLEQGVKLLPVGSSAKLIIPSGLAYGANGFANVIPAYSTLIFDVELIDIK